MEQLVTKDTIEKQVTTTVKEDVIVLRLNKSQAATLHQIVWCIGGDPGNSARKLSRQLVSGFIAAQVGRADHPVQRACNTIYFNEGFDPRYPL